MPSLHLLDQLFPHQQRPLIMGILNVTPDSFSDGNLYYQKEAALAHAHQLIEEGADIIDIGGESSRPGSEEITAEEEISRVIPLLQQIRQFSNIPISIDTRKAQVADLAIRNGANIINDISGLEYDINIIQVLKRHPKILYVLMHMQGTPKTMQDNPFYENTVKEVIDFFKAKINYCVRVGISKDRIIIDPGIGFGKNSEHNLEILAEIDAFKQLHQPILIGASRKRFIGAIDNSHTDQRLGGSLAVASLCQDKHIDLIRVHDVHAHKQFFKLRDLIYQRN